MLLTQVMALPRRARSVLLSLVALRIEETEDTFRHRILAVGHACFAIWYARRDILELLRSGDPAKAHELRCRFGLGVPLGPVQHIPQSLFCTPKPRRTTHAATVVIPIYNAADMVEVLLARLPTTLPRGQSVLLVDDGSTDPRIRQAIEVFERAWPDTDTLRLTRNQGFIAAVNAAFEKVPRNHHVILLNSDTIPPKGWVPRLIAPMNERRDTATVTPLSNAAEILSVPVPGLVSVPTPAMVEDMDAVAQRLRPRPVELPTGIGFCMALNRRYLNRVGGFDSAFGTGYGEEVDWCQKAQALGGRHVVATNLVVGHHGGASFGDARRRARIAAASKTIADRYPDFDTSVSAWVDQAPVAPERLAIALAWAAHEATGDIPVFIAHTLGGGAETALQTEISEARRGGTNTAIVLRVGGLCRWRLELHHASFQLAGDIENTELLHTLLEPVVHRRVIYSCAVHAADPETVPDTLLQLAEGQRLSVRMHDFFPVSPSWNLLDQDGQYRGVPALDTNDPAHTLATTPGRAGITHRTWRARWARVMEAAEEVTVFSHSSGDLVRQAFPKVRDTIVVRPHTVKRLPPKLRPGGKALGVLGGINHAKGGTVLQKLARTGNRRIAIIGELDGCFSLSDPHVVHGRYQQDEIAKLARTYDIGAWFLPSVCPETFSFATREAIATGLPVACFNLGAQAETLAAAANGHVLDLNPEDTIGIANRLERLFCDQTASRGRNSRIDQRPLRGEARL